MSSVKRLASGQWGFTLLEMLVAMGPLAMIGTVFMAALATGTRATGTLDAEAT
ncbi:MAG: prepilin-type N-terminal cleavage/methylation domain-containing protein [Chloroflexota bacterium]